MSRLNIDQRLDQKHQKSISSKLLPFLAHNDVELKSSCGRGDIWQARVDGAQPLGKLLEPEISWLGDWAIISG